MEALGLASTVSRKGKGAEEMGWWVWYLLQCKDLSLDLQGQVKLEAVPVSCRKVGGRLDSKCQHVHIHSDE